MAAIIRSIVPLNDEASDPRFAVELDAGGKCWQFQLGTWVDEHGLRVFSPQPPNLWMAFYAECTSISTPSNVFRVVIRVQ